MHALKNRNSPSLAGTLLEPCWNLLERAGTVLARYWSLPGTFVGTLLEHSWNLPAGTVLEPSRNLVGTVLEHSWNLPAGTVLESSWNCAGTLLEPCSIYYDGTVLELCRNLPTSWNFAGTWLEPCYRTFLEPWNFRRFASLKPAQGALKPYLKL